MRAPGGVHRLLHRHGGLIRPGTQAKLVSDRTVSTSDKSGLTLKVSESN